jgi:hypothetical protein
LYTINLYKGNTNPSSPYHLAGANRLRLAFLIACHDLRHKTWLV